MLAYYSLVKRLGKGAQKFDTSVQKETSKLLGSLPHFEVRLRVTDHKFFTGHDTASQMSGEALQF